MNAYRYTLESGSRRYTCPQCGHRNKFKRYIDNETGNHISEDVGRCDRENNCGYHLRPKEYFERNGNWIEQRRFANPGKNQQHSSYNIKPPERPAPGSFNYIDTELFKRSLNQYDRNNLYLFLHRCFGRSIADHISARYLLGTSKYITGSSVFWYIDTGGKITDGKIMFYDNPITGKRYKGEDLGKPAVNWVHSVMRIRDFKRKPCFFGEHLLTIEPARPVIIVESEKTAIIASVFFHDRIVLATGGQQSLNDRLYWELLKGRQVQLIPDTSHDDKAFKEWKSKADQLNTRFRINIQVSDFLNTRASESEKLNGFDLADFLTKNRAEQTGLILFDGYPVTWEFFHDGDQIQKYNDKPEEYQSEW